jgi:ribonuclease T1
MQGKPVFLSKRPLAGRALRKLALALSVSGALLSPIGAWSKDAVPTIGTVTLTELPREARDTDALIRAGGPFPYSKDGTTFGNRERLLPEKARGYYREYTVKTPGAHDRGARRIVCGGHKPTAPDACFYTRDHYASFARVAQ